MGPDTEDIIQLQPKRFSKTFLRDVKALLKADCESREAAERRAEAKEPVQAYVAKHSVLNRDGTAQRILIVNGWKVQWTAREGKAKVDEAARLEWCRKHAKHLVKKVPTVSDEEWEALKTLGKVPKRALAKIEKTESTTYYLKWWLTTNATCPKCDGDVHNKDAFCKHCGLKLVFGKKKRTQPKTKKAAPRKKPKKKAARKRAA